MSAQAIQNEHQFIRQSYDMIVVGTGPVGVRFINEMVRLDSKQTIAVFGDEPWHPYNRVKLSLLVSGEVKESSLYASHDLSSLSSVTTFYNNRICEIDRYTKEVVDSDGKRYGYRKLILATGSRPHIPMIEGLHLDNVFTFRDLNDAQSLMGRSVRTRSTVILGGGLLGLEAARAMQRFNTEVHVIEHSMWPMFNQLDQRAGAYVKDYVEELGIHFHTGERVKRILGDNKVSGIILSNNIQIDCDTIIIAAGIVSNTVLAMDAGLQISKGIRVNDQLQTSDKDIFAIGECAEHKNKVYGLVAPGYEQAAVLAHHLHGETSQYKGSISATNLKVLDFPVFSVGDNGESARSNEIFIYEDKENRYYRKIIVINGRIRGAMGIGDWPGVNRIQEAVEKQRRLWPWQTAGFIKTGLLWNNTQSENVIDWPASATVCNCTGVTRGQLDKAMQQGANTAELLATATGASTVCGSCKNLVSDFVGGNTSPEPITGYKVIVVSSLVALVICMIAYFLPSLTYDTSADTRSVLDQLWRDSGYKQLTGYSLLGLSIFISLISLRKRLTKAFQLWDFAYWRLTHVVIGMSTLVILLLHTGFRFGDNLNFLLMMVFSSLLFVGSVAGFVIGYEHIIPRRLAKQLRNYATWSHILLLWPLPALLGFHIFKTYYF